MALFSLSVGRRFLHCRTSISDCRTLAAVLKKELKRYKRSFIGERGAITTPKVRQPRNVLYTFEEATEIFIRAKTAEGVRPGTITGYDDIFRYFRQWFDDDITHIDDITADTIRH
jgi:hypothetical protein